MITVRHLDKHFNKNKRNKIHVLNDISLDFPQKGLVVLLGPSGSGKTTLLNVIGGLDKVDKGSITFFDKEINRYQANLWDKIRTEDVGYVFQNYYLMSSISVFDNVAFVLKMMGIHDKVEIEKRVNYILNQVGMYRFRKKRASQLSGGQQQRVAIARALVKNPKVIIADEPTGNLDSKNTLEIMNIIKSISLNKLVILVTHEKDIAKFYADRIIELKDGMIIDDYVNGFDQEHNFSNENVIYLKDLEEKTSLKNDVLDFKVYTDDENIDLSEVKLIIKNKTIYIDIKSSVDKIKLVNEDSHISIKNEKYKKKTRAEMLETTFDENLLDHSELHKQKRLTISFKNSFWIALRKVFNFGRKGKLMMAIFAFSGMLMAFSIVNLYTILRMDYRELISKDENYIEVTRDYDSEKTLSEMISDYNSASGNTLLVNFNQYYFSEINIVLPNDNYKLISSTNIMYDYLDIIESDEIIHGRMPTSNDEIVITSGIYAQGTTSDTNFTEVGIWSLSELLGEVISIRNPKDSTYVQYKIVGIVDRLYKAMYFVDHLDVYRFRGADPISEDISRNELFELIIKIGSKHVVYGENTSEFYQNLVNLGYDVKMSSSDAIIQNDIRIQQGLAANLLSSLFLVGGALLAFYFVMRSSMISRIYEISVYRALGVRKIEIYGSFAVEIGLLTLISSFLGFAFMSTILASIASSDLQVLFDFRVDAFIILLGSIFVFGSYLIIGMLPMTLLLRKTPSQIISSYDM